MIKSRKNLTFTTLKEDLFMAMHLNSDNFNQVISKGKVMVDFWAPWCMPCQSLLPVIDELSGELEGKAVVAKVNVDENKPIAREYGVMSIPTVVFFVDGVEKEVVEGVIPFIAIRIGKRIVHYFFSSAPASSSTKMVTSGCRRSTLAGTFGVMGP